jgi:hypothetical protein
LISRSRPGHKSSWISFSLFFLIFLCCFFYFSEIQWGREKKEKKSFRLLWRNPAVCHFVPRSNCWATQHKIKNWFFYPFKLGSGESLLSPDTIEINSKSWFFSFLNK